MFKLIFIVVIVLSSFGCAKKNKEVSITMERDGDVTLMNQDDIVADFAKTESLVSLVEDFKDVDFDVFIRADVESNVPLYHPDGDDKVSGDLRLRGGVFECDKGFVNYEVAAYIYRNEKNESDADNFYSLIMYVPQLMSEIKGSVLRMPPVDLCVQINIGVPNKNPYKNGSTQYTSNVITISAGELEVVLVDYGF